MRIGCEWQDFTAKVTDFGLAKVGPGEDRSHVTTEVMGTMGYACPAYVQTGEREAGRWGVASSEGSWGGWK